MQKSTSSSFKGFKQPEQNYSKLPHEFIDLLPDITALTEIKVLVYLLRHTWGYSEYDTLKRITIDEFVSGRKRKDGTRIDAGTGLSEQGVRDGIKKALDHEYITVEVDDSDKARVKKFYGLNILGLGVQDLESGVQNLDPDPPNSIPRTEKETIERNYKKQEAAPKAKANGTRKSQSIVRDDVYEAIMAGWELGDDGLVAKIRQSLCETYEFTDSDWIKRFVKWYKAHNKFSLPMDEQKIKNWYGKFHKDPRVAIGITAESAPASNYSDEVRAMTEERYKEKGLLK